MSRLRLGVALLPPEPLATEINGLRRALGDGSLGRIPPHITLVPPVNVNVVDLPLALALLRNVCAGTRPFDVTLGPVQTFAPTNPVVFLGLGDGASAVVELRNKIFVPPLERTLTFPFVPHLTIADDVEDWRIQPACEAFEGYCVSTTFERLHLLQEGPSRIWSQIADFSFAGPTVIGRGGIELELTTSQLVDPESAELFEGRLPSGDLVVTARQGGAVVAVAVGSSGVITECATQPGPFGEELEAQVGRHWHYEASRM